VHNYRICTIKNTARTANDGLVYSIAMSVNSCCFADLSDDEVRRSLSFLWYTDLGRSRTVCKRFKFVVDSDSTLFFDMLAAQLTRCGVVGIEPEAIRNSTHNSTRKALMLAARLAPWPRDADIASLRYELDEVHVDGQTSKCVAYTGALLGKNRTFVADYHFPVFRNYDVDESEGMLQSACPYPFTKVYYDKELGRTVPMLSGVAYFEITIHRAPRRDTPSVNPEGAPPCVAIGLANHLHRLNSMPGWDRDSYGFHGDDGLYYHNWDFDGREFTTDPEAAQFGEGDTVGLGLVYSYICGAYRPQKFMTKNGKLVGAAVDGNSNAEFYTWFPCVGTDTHSPIEMNFGNKGVPFMFDVVAFEKELIADVAQSRSKSKIARSRAKAVTTGPDGLLHVDSFPAIPTPSFRDAYWAPNKAAGGLYRDRAFMAAARAHVEANHNPGADDEWCHNEHLSMSGDDSEHESGSSGSDWGTEESGSGGGDDAEGSQQQEGHEVGDDPGNSEGEHSSGSEWEEEEGEEGGDDSDPDEDADSEDDSIASETQRGSLVPPEPGSEEW
jgi:hypothetical protein